MDTDWIMSRLMIMLPLWLSLSVHEWAHAWSAYMLGDDTASLQGRLTLNPIAHIDPIGTLLLPLMGVPFGWAKPVPINPAHFRHDVDTRRGMMITAAAGPLSNIVLAVFATVVFVVVTLAGVWSQSNIVPLFTFFQTFIMMNVILALFNILPILPLDGSRVADSLMPEKYRPMWDQFCKHSMFVLIAVILLPNLLGFSLFGWAAALVYKMLHTLLFVLSG